MNHTARLCSGDWFGFIVLFFCSSALRGFKLIAHDFVDNSSPASGSRLRPVGKGKFLYRGAEKLYIKGVTYGPFRPDRNASEYNTREVVARDFEMMRQYGINAVRLFTMPPTWLLDLAAEREMLVMAGAAWEQHIRFLDSRRTVQAILRTIRDALVEGKNHPALLACSIGNEIPASIVRWYGSRSIEAFLHRLYAAVKEIDPQLLVTYVNYPTTEYLELPFLDFSAFNVYLERTDQLQNYLLRLQNLAGEKPLLISELGFDSRRNGLDQQAIALHQQVKIVFRCGGTGVFVFSWTDEWHRGGCDIEDWDFGLTERDRRPKPALASVRRAFLHSPPLASESWPFVSVVICVKDGAGTLRECLDGVSQLVYPRYEVIVVDDGSTDDSALIAEQYADKVIVTDNHGLSSARNTGLGAASGEIVAYLDADAYPDRHWLTYLVQEFQETAFVAIGGPNIAPPAIQTVGACVASAPGGPQHVLLDDRTAEHIPGCNMAFRRNALLEIGGFDAQFRIAGDDVDVCWRLQENGGKIGFSPTAQVWHYPRQSVRAYWKQQYNYGRSEAMVERKWPEKYNRFGHLVWRGRLYGNGPILLSRRVSRIYHGVWGTGLFQTSIDQPPSVLNTLVHMPEWWLAIAILTGSSLAGLFWMPLLPFFLTLVLGAAGVTFWQAFRLARGVEYRKRSESSFERLGLRSLTALLYLIQPVARLSGRLSWDLSPRRLGREGGSPLRIPRTHILSCWTENGRPLNQWLTSLEMSLRSFQRLVMRGGPYDRWDFEVWTGLLGGVRVLTSIEEHGQGRQMFCLKASPRVSWTGIGFISLFALLALVAGLSGPWQACALLGSVALIFTLRTLQEYAAALDSVVKTLQRWHLLEVEDARTKVDSAVRSKGQFLGEMGQ